MIRPKILFVDDERSNLTGFKYMFAEYYDIRTAESADEALSLLGGEGR
jgi:CheY-like chemotaxis protein